jgi:adenosylcobinamide-GDP ribazoletransferase
MASLVHDTVAWLRFYSGLPIPPLSGETADAAPDVAHSVQFAPIAGAAIGAVGGLVLIAAWGLRLPSFLAATLAVAALVVSTGALPERCLARTTERLGGEALDRDIGVYGMLAVVLVLLMRIGAVDGLIAFGSLKAALALVAAGAVSRAAAMSMMPSFAPGSLDGSRLDVQAFQRLAAVAIAIGAIALLPTYGIGPAIAALAAACAAAAAVAALAPRFAGDERTLAGSAEQAAEVAFLVAALVFARSP